MSVTYSVVKCFLNDWVLVGWKVLRNKSVISLWNMKVNFICRGAGRDYIFTCNRDTRIFVTASSHPGFAFYLASRHFIHSERLLWHNSAVDSAQQLAQQCSAKMWCSWHSWESSEKTSKSVYFHYIWTNDRKSVIDNKRNKAFFKDVFPPCETPPFPSNCPVAWQGLKLQKHCKDPWLRHWDSKIPLDDSNFTPKIYSIC